MDTKPLKIIIVHASAGDGHRKAALAVEKSAKTLLPGASVEVLDAVNFFPPFVKSAYPGIYLFMIRKAPWMWGLSYELSHSGPFARLNAAARRLFNGFYAKALERKLEESGADVVIATHFLACEVVSHLKRRGRLSAKLLTVVTDILVHRFWVFPETDFYAAATERTKEELLSFGADPSRVRVTGIPVDPKFGRVSNRILLAAKLGIASDRFTVLVTSGGAGAGPVRHVIDALKNEPSIQILVICGRNEELYRELAKGYEGDARVKPFGFVDNMDELMDCSDVIVGKAGGLTLSEALAKRKPFCILSPVPGQETRNAEVLCGKGAAFRVKSYEDLTRRIRDLMNEPQDKLYAAIDELRRPRSAEDVVRLAEEICRGR